MRKLDLPGGAGGRGCGETCLNFLQLRPGQVAKNRRIVSVSVSHLKEEGEGVVSQFSEQFLLDLSVSQLLFVLHFGVNLPGHQEEVPPEGHAHHIHVLTAVPKCTRQHHKH